MLPKNRVLVTPCERCGCLKEDNDFDLCMVCLDEMLLDAIEEDD